MVDIVFGMVLPWVLVGLLCWLGYQLILQNGRLLLRFDDFNRRLDELTALGAAPVGVPTGAAAGVAPAPVPLGLPVGTEAPAFELPDLNGTPHTLAQYRGRRVLMVFYSTQCGFCTGMLSRLAALAKANGSADLVPLLITSGSLEENRRQMTEHGVSCPVLLQKGMEVYLEYQGNGTPTGYLIDEQGKIASPLAVGSEALLALAQAPSGSCVDGQPVPARGKANRGLHTSKLVRDGLKAGTPAPAFRLPRLDGGDLVLEKYRGRRVLLVFSDPQCGPCDALAPKLEQLHRRRPDLKVLMVSRRDPAENRQKVKQLGLTFPVALQKAWEISKLYGMFATPIGYLIDERGVLAADVAAGEDAILALATVPAPAANGAADGHAHDRAAHGEEVMPMRR
jgi:peroxiredoxin